MTSNNKWLRGLFFTLFTGVLIWLGLTMYVQMPNGHYIASFGPDTAPQRALILYDADPFDNLDQQLSTAFASGLTNRGWNATVSTVKAIRKEPLFDYDLYVFCANTYNGEPDWTISHYLRSEIDLSGKAVVGICVGAGATARAQRTLECKINKAGGFLLDARSFSLARPNDSDDQSKLQLEAARTQVMEWAAELVAQQLVAVDE
ncbi:MAG: hypothetical protein AAF433_12425 [Bacteroidota bacterium]